MLLSRRGNGLIFAGMKVKLAYGEGYLEIELPAEQTTVISPIEQAGLPDEAGSFRATLEAPIGTGPLRDRVSHGERICIVFTDITRATPNERIIPWVLDYLRGCGVRRDQVTLLNRHLLDADTRIVTGFIEPHFFAGFSGGPKGIMPGVAGLETVVSNHGRRNIGSPNAAFGITKGNPLWEEMRDIALRAGPSFLVNVTLNERRAITGVFAGDLIGAHEQGIEFVRKSAMQPVAELFDIVITTNSGYPLDQNLYQAVKGMSAGARIVKKGGAIIIAAECRAGIPDGSPFHRLSARTKDPEDILALIARETFPEQWQSQVQALIQRKARIFVHSSMADEVIRGAHLLPAPDIEAVVEKLQAESGRAARIAVLPQGPLTIPYLAQ